MDKQWPHSAQVNVSEVVGCWCSRVKDEKFWLWFFQGLRLWLLCASCLKLEMTYLHWSPSWQDTSPLASSVQNFHFYKLKFPMGVSPQDIFPIVPVQKHRISLWWPRAPYHPQLLVGTLSATSGPSPVHSPSPAKLHTSYLPTLNPHF